MNQKNFYFRTKSTNLLARKKIISVKKSFIKNKHRQNKLYKDKITIQKQQKYIFSRPNR